jgi:hypothetical protein
MNDHSVSNHAERMHGPGCAKFPSGKKAHGPTQSTTRTPVKSELTQWTKTQVAFRMWIQHQQSE